MAEVLRWWLVGQGVAVAVIAVSTWIGLALIGMPGALLLGVQAGLVNFIPYLGPVIAAVPIVLAAMAQGTSMVIWALGVHIVIQTLEGYVLAPLIQRRAVDLPPVLTLAAVMLFGALFGAMGVALATPLVALIKVAVERLYIEDRTRRVEAERAGSAIALARSELRVAAHSDLQRASLPRPRRLPLARPHRRGYRRLRTGHRRSPGTRCPTGAHRWDRPGARNRAGARHAHAFPSGSGRGGRALWGCHPDRSALQARQGRPPAGTRPALRI